MEKAFSSVTKSILLTLGFLVPIALSAWVIDSSDRISASKTYKASNLTEYIASNSSGTNYIFEDINNTEGGNGSGFYSNLTSDRTYQNIDGFHRNIYLGYSDGRVLTLNHSVVFAHSNKKIDYSESDFLSEGSFTPKDGDGDSGTEGSYYVKYFANKDKASKNEPSYISKYNYATNYYRNNNSSKPLFYNDYKSDGTYEKKSYIPKGYLYTIKLAGDIIIKEGSFLSIGALSLSTNGGGEAGGIIEGNNVELDLNGHTITIEEGATLNAYGYLVDTRTNADGTLKGAIYNHGTIYSPMVVCDYSGGGNTVGRAFSSIVPFSMFNMPYLSAKVYFYDTSKLLCPTALYASSTLSKIVCKIIGSDSNYFIQLKNSESLVIAETKNNRSSNQKIFYSGDEKNGSETKEGFRCSLAFYGDIQINSLKLNLTMKKSVAAIDASFDMAAFNFPIAPFYSFAIENGSTVTCPLTLEFYPGSSLVAKENSQIIFSNSSYNNHYTVDLPIVGKTDYEIKKGTSYGGLIIPTELPATADSTYYYGSNYPYSFTSSWFSKYLIEEKDLLSKKEPRVHILGSIESKLKDSEADQHILSGYMDIDTSKNVTFLSKIKNSSYVEKEFNYVSPSLSGVSIKFESSGKTLCSAISQPLCDRNLNVINPLNINGNFDSSTSYDFLSGIYTCPRSSKKFVCLNEEGKFVEVRENSDGHYVALQDEMIGTEIRYLYFRNLFVSAEKYDANLFDEKGNLVTRNSDGKYTLKYSYAGYNKETFYVKNGDEYTQAMNIGEGDYYITSTIEGSSSYNDLLKTIKSQIESDSEEINLNGQAFNSVPFKQLATNVATVNEFGTFMSKKFNLTGYPTLYKKTLFWYSEYEDTLSDETGDLEINYYTNFKTRLKFDKTYGSWVKTSNSK